MKKTVLTGIKPTGHIHLGNYIGAIKPALELAQVESYKPMYFIADAHALTNKHDVHELKQLTRGMMAAWLALGLDPEKAIVYKQSDIPEIFELAWILSTLTPKGLMNRAHAYKAIVDENERGNKEKDTNVNMGLYNYPVLMAADILLFQTDVVPVGNDQLQHIEIARDLADRFNHSYGKTFTLPTHSIQETAILPGLDGRKMSKSYKNTIPLFEEPKSLQKLINQIKTDSSPPEAPKDPEQSIVFTLYKQFASAKAIEQMHEAYQSGISWGDAKKELFSVINQVLEQPRETHKELLAAPEKIDRIVAEGAEKARALSAPFLQEVKERMGM
ncbi:tryptophanyl-tRNA synthetase [Alkalihalobacillus xiaoxiensis]|uniref:Tryptophan--tRNA ligase n=1 Tax=Shouchella xiaoxiensis TaxID=766895 RepID=A0ABS2SMT3_9BACI|nr:tryptophan--tRNA ligase [Shouchella xiaoxiensis]MBM7836824.1 tryptophanyl-tRNA synthetase [Shouchella xiaoxiensis]